MPLPFELTAENVVEYAKQNNIELTQGAASWGYPKLCAIGTLAHAINKNKKEDGSHMSMYAYFDFYAKEIGIDEEDLHMIEAGFENYGHKYHPGYKYWEMGREIYRLSR